jgi:hypothetical protein
VETTKVVMEVQKASKSILDEAKANVFFKIARKDLKLEVIFRL